MPFAAGALAPEFARTVGVFATSTPSEHIEESGTLVFYGDVLLARAVERQMRRYGHGYPFGGLIAPPDATVVANFESAVPAVHQPTPDGSVRFSTPASMLSALSAADITHVSLANNHSFDFGASGFRNTERALAEAGVTPFGHPNRLSDRASIAYETIGSSEVALIGINAVGVRPDAATLTAVLATATERSDMQIAYVHWGPEYVTSHAPSQRRLAEHLVTAGADLIIGHHPHVIQDIELIGGVPVLYSLGNHIFDQYFSPEVQVGLVASLHLSAKPALVLTPVESFASPGQPRPSTGSARARILRSLAERSDPAIAPAIERGIISLPLLATSD